MATRRVLRSQASRETAIGGLTVKPKVHLAETLLDLPKDANVRFPTLKQAIEYGSRYGLPVWRVVGERGAWVEILPIDKRFTTLFSGVSGQKSQAFAAKNGE